MRTIMHDQPGDFDPHTHPLATHAPARGDDVNFVISSVERSGWQWIRLANGDLILGVFPRGDTYSALEGRTGGV